MHTSAYALQPQQVRAGLYPFERTTQTARATNLPNGFPAELAANDFHPARESHRRKNAVSIEERKKWKITRVVFLYPGPPP